MASHRRIIRIIREDILENVVSKEAPKAASAVITQSSAWHKKANHNKGCDRPELVGVKTTKEEARFNQFMQDNQQIKTLQEALQTTEEETKTQAEEEGLQVHRAAKQKEAAMPGRGSSNDYLGGGGHATQGGTKSANDYMPGLVEGNCACGAHFTANPAEQNEMQQGNLLQTEETTNYGTNMVTEEAGTSNYMGVNTTNTQPGNTMTSGNLVGYDGKKKGNSNSTYVP